MNRLVRIQLAIFAIVSIAALAITAIVYLRLPNAVGIGTYHVTVDLPATGGIYGNANVAYRGVTVGKVESVGLSDDGIVASLKLDSANRIPENVNATVKSVSAIGEQYIDLVPPDHAATALLRDGYVIPRERTAISQDIAGLLSQADALIRTVRDSRLQDLLRETFLAFNGSGQELAQLLRSTRELVDDANANSATITTLLTDLDPFLDAQIRSGDDIKLIAASLAELTTEAVGADTEIRALLSNTPSVAETASTTFAGIRPSFPVLAANMANAGRIGAIYHKGIEQVLVVMPALFAALLTVAYGQPLDEGGKLDFKLSIGDPPPCNVGFLPANQMRTPADITLRDVPRDMYCKVAQNDPSVVRGARNYPCMEYPGKRAPTIELCRDPRGYVPIGTNPWRGPPIPYGTPMGQSEDQRYEPDSRNILPPNKFPYIPPEADYDPGPPVVHLPPGVPAGPGPAPNGPFPLPFPPPDGPAPPPLPYVGPTVPPYGVAPPPPPAAPEPPGALPAEVPPMPQASGPAYATYDRNGAFVDPAGGTGIFLPGVTDAPQPENWSDLMLGPKPM